MAPASDDAMGLIPTSLLEKIPWRRESHLAAVTDHNWEQCGKNALWAYWRRKIMTNTRLLALLVQSRAELTR